MPRRFLVTRHPSPGFGRLKQALLIEGERPRSDELIESQDHKLQLIKKSVFNSTAGPIKLTAEHAVLLSQIVDAPQPALMISTHYNDTEQSLIQAGSRRSFSISDIDFSKAEDFLQLETPIDARRDHNMMKLAYSIPSRTFMSRILHRYPCNRKRLAFIQRRLTKASDATTALNHQPSLLKAGDNKEVVISCLVCGLRFSRQHQFQHHILTHPDPDNKRFLCQACGKRFNRADHLNRHAVLHGDVHMHKCLLCGEEFDRASHLDRHRRKHHPPLGQAPSQTPPLTPQLKSPLPQVCLSPAHSSSPTITSGSNLHLLASVATPEEEPLLEPVPETFIQTQVIVMDSMSDTYNYDTVLQDQDQTQTQQDHQLQQQELEQEAEPEPDRPFACDMCSRKFIRATHLRRHMRIHTGEKPFACHICGRRYARGDYLRAHIQAHRRDKIHKCKHCGEMFHDLTRFADHCRIVHRDINDEYGNPCPPPPDTPPLQQVCVAEDPLELEGAEISLIPSSPPPSPSCIPIMTYASCSSNGVGGEQVVELIANMLAGHPPSPSHHHHHHCQGLENPPLASMMSPDFQLSQLQGLGAQSLLHNGLATSVPETGNEVVILNHPKVSQFLDHYILNGSSISSFSTP